MTTTIQYLVGDATAPIGIGSRIIVHVCNDIGGWGAGFVLAISKRWPLPESEYRKWCGNRKESGFGLGEVQLVQVEAELFVANLIGQHGLRRNGAQPPIRYDAGERRPCQGQESCSRAQGNSTHASNWLWAGGRQVGRS